MNPRVGLILHNDSKKQMSGAGQGDGVHIVISGLHQHTLGWLVIK